MLQKEVEPIKKETKRNTHPEDLKKQLEEFLTFKYVLDNRKLETELNQTGWKEKFADWDSIVKILTLKPLPRRGEYFKESPKQDIAVVLPRKLSDSDLNFSFLKGAAYFPYQLDPIPYEEWRADEDILIQLSFAAHYGYWNARYELYQLTYSYPLLEGHIICHELPDFNNAEDSYYSIPLPPEFWGKPKKGKNSLRFDPNVDKENLWKFCDYLVKIVETGERPTGKEYDFTNYEYINRHQL